MNECDLFLLKHYYYLLEITAKSKFPPSITTYLHKSAGFFSVFLLVLNQKYKPFEITFSPNKKNPFMNYDINKTLNI